MSIVVKDKVFELPDEGVHDVVVAEVVDLGLTETTFGTKDRVRIVLSCLDQNGSDGQPLKIFIQATKSLHPKSTLGNYLNQLQVPTGSEFDLEDLIGIKGQAVVQHNQGNNGKTYANVVSFLKGKAKTKAKAEISDDDIPF